MAGAIAAISTVNAASGRGGAGGMESFLEQFGPALKVLLFVILILVYIPFLISAVRERKVIKSVFAALVLVFLVSTTVSNITTIFEEPAPSDELIDQWIGWAPIISADGRYERSFATPDGVIVDFDTLLEDQKSNSD